MAIHKCFSYVLIEGRVHTHTDKNLHTKKPYFGIGWLKTFKKPISKQIYTLT